MTSTGIMVGVTYIVIGLLIMGQGRRLAQRKVRINGRLGIRIPNSLKSEDNWYRINEYGGRRLIIWSALVVVLGTVMLFVAVKPWGGLPGYILGALPWLILAIPIVQTRLWARKL